MVTGGIMTLPNTPANTVEIYFTTAAAWGLGASMTVARSSHTATLLSDGRILVTGGFNASGTPLSSAEVYNPLNKSWTTTILPAMNSLRGGHTATLLMTGDVLICGGQSAAGNTNITDSCEIFDTSANTFPAASVTTMNSARIGHTASLFSSGRVFVSGGVEHYLGAFNYLFTNEIYDPVSAVWTPADTLSEMRAQHSATVLNNGNVLIAGGYNAIDQLDKFSLDDEETQTQQLQISSGFLGSVEMFDPNGARVPLAGDGYNVMPYRNNRHGAILKPNGEVHLSGGYGNFPVSYFDTTPVIEEGSFLTLTPIGGAISSSTVSGGLLEFPLILQFSRKVSGRLVNGDIFFSLPIDSEEPSITIANAEAYIQRSTAVIDGLSILKKSCGIGGSFNNIVQLDNMGASGPPSIVIFDPLDVAPSANIVANSTVGFAGPLNEGEQLDLTNTSVLTFDLSFRVPSIYIGGQLTVTAEITGGVITDNLGFYTISLAPDIDTGVPGGVATFTTDGTVAPIVINGTLYGLATKANQSFTSIDGEIYNSTETAINSPQTVVGDDIDALALRIEFTSTRINLTMEDMDTTYNFDVSTVVVREMIFADNLEYNPKDSVWEFNKSTPFLPIFDHNSLLTPADDSLTIGGRNCEANPAADCIRTTKIFEPITEYIVLINQKPGSELWPEEDSLNTKRAYHTSTLLPDKSILTCGGSDGTQPLNSCELLDPITEKWEYVHPMNYTRANHTATLLANGTVLIAGGKLNSSTAAINTVEIYYPDIKKFVNTAPMAYARVNHTATLLPDGNVLITAGGTMNGFSDTSEIYITTETAWQTSGNLATDRAQHTATLLKSGNVLAIGGANGHGATDSVEIYNRATRQWSAVSFLNTKRNNHTANLLKDGRVLVAGGSSGVHLRSAEIYNPIDDSWTYTLNFPSINTGNHMCQYRSNHTGTLLPNGKIMVTGGEQPSFAHETAEGYDVDFSTWQTQGKIPNRVAHTTVLMSDGYLMNIGGFDGVNYLDSTDKIYFGAETDISGRDASIDRQPLISSVTATFDKGDMITLLSGASNFHGITEASGGGPMNSSHHNPRVYIRQIDNPSGFLTDLTTSLYTLYGSQNNDWEKTASSITLIMPPSENQLPYGFYNFWIANNGVFSEGYTVQVTSPRPTGIVANLDAAGPITSTTTIDWSWNIGTVVNSDGYAIFSSSNNVFISTAALTDPGIFAQDTLTPNTPSSIKVGGYNMGGYGDFVQSATYYTLAAVPADLTITDASFETAQLEWSPNSNSDITAYELSMSASVNTGDCFNSNISTPIVFNDNYISTSATLNQLSPNQFYCFRVRAMNGAGETTNFSSNASTVTVGNVNNLQGTAINISEIRWSWDPSIGADWYDIYDITDGEENPVLISSSVVLEYVYQTGLSTNTSHTVKVKAVKSTVDGPVSGPWAISPPVYTLAVAPLPGAPNSLTNISTGSMQIKWIANGNSESTLYEIEIYNDLELKTFSTTNTEIFVNDLIPNTQYTVSIIAYNGDDIANEATDLGSKYTLAQPPTYVAPESISMSGVTIEWNTNDNPDTTYYEVRGSTDSFITISTYVPFSDYHTASSIEINGLMTSTTYYFDVAARNNEPNEPGKEQETARILCVPNVLTLDGPSGAPQGSIAGASDPSKTVIIDGVLPNSRTVSMSIPAGSFPAAATSIAISSSTTNSCNYLIDGKPLEVAIYSENNSQPQVPVTLVLHYNEAEANDKITANEKNLVLARYNPKSGQCLPLKTIINVGQRTITAYLNHFSIFQLILKTAATNLDNISIYPNPFYINRGQGFITIDNIPANSKIRIYTLSGVKVWSGTATSTGLLIWRGVNKYGEFIASGIYLCVIDSSAGKKIVKLAVER